MRTSAILRIIAFTIAALALLFVLAASLAGNFFLRGINLFPRGLSSVYSDSASYNSGPSSISAANIKNVNIDWVAGSINIIPSKSDSISFSETARGSLSDREKMHWRVDGDTLIIRYSDSGLRINSFSILDQGKSLTVEIPAELYLNILDVEAVSADLSIDSISAEKLDIEQVSGKIGVNSAGYSEADIENVSGRIEFSDTDISSIDINTVSGGADLAGSFDELDIEAISGGVTVASGVLPSSARISTVSGRMEVTLPENDGFSAALSSVSGKISNDFPVTTSQGRQTYKSGGPTLKFESVSGGVTIRKG